MSEKAWDPPHDSAGDPPVPPPSPRDYMDEPVWFPPLQVVDLAVQGRAMSEGYSNIVVNRVNRHCLRLAAFEGEYPWHHHPGSDELFLVVQGCLLVDLPGGVTLRLEPWQMATVPAGMVHRTRTEGRTVNLCFEELAADTVFVEPPEADAVGPD